MITKFLYELNEKNRKVLVEAVETKEIFEMGEDFSYPVLLREDYKKNETDNVITNNGNLFYVILSNDEEEVFLDINIFKDGVKLGVTKKYSHAAYCSQEFAESILDSHNYFGYEDCRFVYSGFSQSRKGIEKDNFQSYFRRLADFNFCQIVKNGKNYFLTILEDQRLVLSEDFTKAYRVAKNDVRPLLFINNFMDKDSPREHISFSSFNVFSNKTSFIFAGKGGFKVCKEEGFFIEELNIVPLGYRLVPLERESKLLKDIYQLRKKDTVVGNEKFILQCNEDFVCYDTEKFTLIQNPTLATPMDFNTIDMCKAIISLFHKEDPKFKTYNKFIKYLFSIDENKYEISEANVENSLKGQIISNEAFDFFIEAVLKRPSELELETGIIALKDDKYLKISILSETQFEVHFLDSAFNASVLSEKAFKAINGLLNLNLKKKEIKNYIELLENNVSYGVEDINLVAEYQTILEDYLQTKPKISTLISPEEIRYETRKGALEYLRLYFPKYVFDTASLIKNILKSDETIKNILVVKALCNLDLLGIDMAAQDLNREVNVTTMDTTKWGYLPKITLSNKTKYTTSYRLNFANMPKHIISKYDVILFSKGFDESLSEVKGIFTDLRKLEKSIILANIKTCNFVKMEDSFNEYFNAHKKIKRRYFNHDEAIFKDYLEVNNQILGKLNQEIKGAYEIDYDMLAPVVGNDQSYHMVIKINSKK